jgi:hypothetical protein
MLRRSLLLLAVALLATPAGAQAPAGYDTLSPRAIAESLKVLATLQAQLKAHPKDAPAQYHLGMIAFTLGERANTLNPPPGLDRRTLRLTAGDAFTEALKLDGSNPYYWLGLARFRAAGGDPLGNGSAVRTFQRTLKLFRESADSAQLVQVLLEVGDDDWYFYKKFESRAIAAFVPDNALAAFTPQADLPQRSDFRGASISMEAGLRSTAGRDSLRGERAPVVSDPIRPFGSNDPKPQINLTTVVGAAGRERISVVPRVMMVAINNVVEAYGTPPAFSSFTGEQHYLFARMYYAEAYAIAPTDERVWRSYAGVELARDHWPELERLAEDRRRLVPGDAWGWMTLGLAWQRLKKTNDARAVFDTALALMTPAERSKLDRLDRVLRPSDSVKYARSDSATRANATRLSWQLADPLWSIETEDPRVEFLARIAYAELRYGTLSPRRYGADTYAGGIYVRYGPPTAKLNLFLIYDSGLIFARPGPLSSGGMPAGPGPDRALNARIREWQPARWDNIAESKIDSMPSQVARFRATPDSVDLYLATRAPVRAFDSVTTTNAHPYAKFWLNSRTSQDTFKDSLAVQGTGEMMWIRRLAAGPYYYRVEAIMPGMLAAGRTAAMMMLGTDTTTGFALRGFGMSDLLLATTAEGNAPARWRDVRIAPLTAPVAAGGEVAVVWETYETGRRGTDAMYHVAITLQRDRAKGGRMGMRIVNGIASVTQSMETPNTVMIEYDRTARYAPVIVDNVTLSLGATPPGGYTLSVTVTDKVSGRSTTRIGGITIRQP